MHTQRVTLTLDRVLSGRHGATVSGRGGSGHWLGHTLCSRGGARGGRGTRARVRGLRRLRVSTGERRALLGSTEGGGRGGRGGREGRGGRRME